jgi:uncharacterized protein YndB with AHSA1/START domain
MSESVLQLNPQLDLVLERVVDVPSHLVWAAWTQPAHIMKWFTPAPWKTVDCTIDLRPGGIFHTVMQSPEGQRFPNSGCWLEVVPSSKLVWTTALEPGFRPIAAPAPGAAAPLLFTAVITLEPQGADRTKYTATVIHASPEDRQKHVEMGFHQGWGLALDQLVALFRNS